MSRIASNKTFRVDFGDGEWIDIRSSMSFGDIQDLLGDDALSDLQKTLKVAEFAVKSWNIKDDDGNPVEYSPDKLRLLDVKTMLILQEAISNQYGVSKKN